MGAWIASKFAGLWAKFAIIGAILVALGGMAWAFVRRMISAPLARWLAGYFRAFEAACGAAP